MSHTERLRELRAVREVLLPDADDPHVLSELTEIETQIASLDHHHEDDREPELAA